MTDGGRYDVDVSRRLRTAIYWEETPLSVRRCSWFFKGSLETRYTPYDEDMAEKLEEEYHNSLLHRYNKDVGSSAYCKSINVPFFFFFQVYGVAFLNSR